MNTPAVSVIMSIYEEKEEWLEESIDSILNQSFFDFEFIIINDKPGRVINTIVLNSYEAKDERVVIVNNATNIGLTKSLNIGLELAKGIYIARMDADDISLVSRLETQYNYLESNPDCIVCGSYVENFGLKKGVRKYPISHRDCLNELIINSCFAHPAVMFKKEVLVSNNIKYNLDMKQSQDYRLWVDLLGYGELHNIPKALLKYRITDQQVSAKSGNSQKEFATQCRKAAVSKLVNDKEFDKVLSDSSFGSKNIKYIASKFSSFRNITPLLWLSLDKYKVSDFLRFILSGSFVKCSILQNLAIVKRFILGPERLI